jgi:hypothetical protein
VFRSRGIRVSQRQPTPPGIFSFPELADDFRRLIQPFTVCQQRDEFDSAVNLTTFGFKPQTTRNILTTDLHGGARMEWAGQMGMAGVNNQSNHAFQT